MTNFSDERRAKLQLMLGRLSYVIEEILRYSQENKDEINPMDYEGLIGVIDMSMTLQDVLAPYGFNMQAHAGGVDMPFGFGNMFDRWQRYFQEVLAELTGWLESGEPRPDTIADFTYLYMAVFGPEHPLTKRVMEAGAESFYQAKKAGGEHPNLANVLNQHHGMPEGMPLDPDVEREQLAEDLVKLRDFFAQLDDSDEVTDEDFFGGGHPAKNPTHDNGLEFLVMPIHKDIMYYLTNGEEEDRPERAHVDSYKQYDKTTDAWRELFESTCLAAIYDYRFPGSMSFVHRLRGDLVKIGMAYGLIPALDEILDLYGDDGSDLKFTKQHKDQVLADLREEFTKFWKELKTYCTWSSFRMDDAKFLLEEHRAALGLR
ncbi:MAG: hypothetical protein Q3962_05405 [Corynebacterium sp.]|nr:hypothetical protein [Corynebacterium sp.]